ncbi:UDP-glucose 4-epimerase-like [Mercenaria mercenaria]|uniref:UDP-glucose 4-epimerase-like n=1 Tax=Mercenaria mercenaria TaxID=6596 RepID=UPI00234F713F|nr:UDP-glucose 4-epimerase-like [Mercenaria mercenaria]XP_045182171.2 UDP-glucose 4-epimerase-like [Mercenaria mercenaria]
MSSKGSMSSKGCILATGGAGYVGTHTVVELLNEGYDVVVVDNLANATMEGLKRIEEITGKRVPAYNVNLLDTEGLKNIFSENRITCVMHFAGFKAVGKSVDIPLQYYKNNIGGTVNLLEVMNEFKVYNMIFSSSATVYGVPEKLPFVETDKTGGCTNPYGKTKFFIEEIMKDLYTADQQWNIVMLRYFNPIGAHKSGRIGESPIGIPHNLMPYISKVAAGELEFLTVYGGDYETKDGTGVRDYTHVVDLAKGHVAALKSVKNKCGLKIYNLGTGKAYSVLEMVKAFEKASGKTVKYKIAPRRAGDLPTFWSDVSLAKKELGWEAEKDLDEMCEDIWRWQCMNPGGYPSGQSKST